MVGGTEAGTLARSLADLAQDAGRTGELYGLLGEFCHVMRNRLHCVNMTLYLARRVGTIGAGPAGRIEARYLDVERFLDQLQWVCRPAEVRPLRSDLGLLLEERWATWSSRLAARGCRLEAAEGSRRADGWFDPCRLTTALEALAAWRADVLAPGTAVLLRWRSERGQLRLDWAESGGPSRPADGLAPADAPASLALAMVARAAADHRGSMTVVADEPLTLTVRWPSGVEPRRAARPARPPLTGPARRA